ncbi:hypothetical protein CK489_20155 [Bradyrhizobium sp. UFLA03-84]|uniref:DUF2934 domain-containing protein n=1 Tax=Bradyrhizobium sp. UFLA03-84 TaxID=418599 RepID=UPI000BAE4BD9|nr:DUF2934 domain-containing protein [Bradyrhizobium sp. UFLA03-84]PAY07985.1 hypothetical protein CK489_20155 [Bradyrhizobium sp. UFLA03-84]
MSGPTEQEIRTKAYQLWKEAGEPAGNMDTFWYQAEKELLLKERSEPGDPPPGLTDNLPI